MTRSQRRPAANVTMRRGRISDLAVLVTLENAVFDVDILSRRSFRRFLTGRGADLIVTEEGGELIGYALVLYPPRSRLARLYSIAVALHARSLGLGTGLLAAAESAALRRRRRAMRLEVHEHNARAIALYEKSGYRLFGQHRDYYDDHGDALRFEKPLAEAAQRRVAMSAEAVLLPRTNRL